MNPDDFRLQEPPGPKHYVAIGEPEGVLTRSEDSLMWERIQVMERVIMGVPGVGLVYRQSLAKAGLKPMDLYF